MPDYYVDSSVLVKRHVDEVGSNWVHTITDPATGNVIITARLSIIEVISALNRRVREANISQLDYDDLVTDFLHTCAMEYVLVELTAVVVAQARHLLEHYPLRAYDAVQLASAVVTQQTFQAAGFAPLTLITADERLLTAARAEGLAIDNPAWHV